MNKDLFKKLCLNFNKEPDKELYDLWNEELEVINSIYVEKAIKNIMKKDKFMPNLNRVFEELNKLGDVYITEEEKVKKWVQNGVKPSWYNNEIINEKIDKETEEIFEDFNNFIQEFRNEG